MMVYLNGSFLPEEQARISVFDRGFLYGDALFETLRVHKGAPFQWQAHLDRLASGANALGIQLPFGAQELREAAVELCRLNRMPEAVLRMNLSRGVGERGYSPRRAGPTTVVLSLHPAPPLTPEPAAWKLITTNIRLPGNDSLAPYKTGNKLRQILARGEADEKGANEAVMLDATGKLAEGTCSNLFWIRRGTVFTPPAAGAVLPGITRAFVLHWCAKAGTPLREIAAEPAELLQADGVFLSLSTLGIVEASQLDSAPLSRSPLIRQIYVAWLEALNEASAV